MATRISIPSLPENNLIRNNCFGQGLMFYRFSGTGSAEVLPGPPAFCRFSEGRLIHIFDIDNQEHAAPESVFPFKGKCVLKFRARGKGTLQAGIRWQLSYAKGDMEHLVRTTTLIELEEEFKEYTFEEYLDDQNLSINDRIFFDSSDGFADITGISLYYPSPAPGVTFDMPHIVALPGEEFSFTCHGAEEILICSGHSTNETPSQLLKKSSCITWSMKATGGEGLRFVGVGKEANCRSSLFVSTPPPALTQRMRRCRFSEEPKHLLFLGDSLTAYDAGRNFTDIAGAFLPSSWSYTNAGIGGDDLPRLVKRLQGKPRTYRLEDFENLWQKTPDEIFLFYGANDTKSTWRNGGYPLPATVSEKQLKLLEDLYGIFKEKAPHAEVTIISCSPGSFVHALENASSFREADLTHALFGIPENIENYNLTGKNFACEKGWGYLDFHKICTAHENPASLFLPGDGVHMTLEGHHLLATALLEYLHKKNALSAG